MQVPILNIAATVASIPFSELKLFIDLWEWTSVNRDSTFEEGFVLGV